MTCGWDHAGRWFYDGWVGRDMSGDLYTPFPVKEEDKELPQKVSSNLIASTQQNGIHLDRSADTRLAGLYQSPSYQTTLRSSTPLPSILRVERDSSPLPDPFPPTVQPPIPSWRRRTSRFKILISR